MEYFMEIMSEPFVWGLLVGFVLILLLWRSMRKDKVYLRGELSRLKEEKDEMTKHLNTQLKINAKGNELLEKQLIDLKEKNENLRVNLNTAQQRPGKAELRRLDVMEAAVSVMRESAPGFASAWERALREAEDEQVAAESGLKKLMRKVMPNFRPMPAIGHSPEEKEEDIKG